MRLAAVVGCATDNRLSRTTFLSVIFLVFFVTGSFPVCGRSPQPPTSRALFSALLKQAPSINPQALQAALTSLEQLQTNGLNVRSDVLAVIDYTKPSTEPRLWVFDLIRSQVLFLELVAHGRNSGDNRTVRFSNQSGSLMSSLGMFLTRNTYIGEHGLSLRLQGLEKGINDKSMERAIVIHAASYVSEKVARREKRIGRSWGCPAVRPEISRQLIKTIENGTLLLAYYPERSWLKTRILIDLGKPVKPADAG